MGGSCKTDIRYSRPLWETLALKEGVRPSVNYQESHSVIRVRIIGPEPFNTLVIVRGFAPLALPHDDIGNHVRESFSVRSNFLLHGYDQRVEPICKHSTAAALSHMWLANHFAFTYGVDDVTGCFDENGRWLINLSTAVFAARPGIFEPGNALWGWVHFSSWIMCWEPEVNKANPGAQALNPQPQPIE